MLGLPDAAVGAIVAALITGLISLLGLIISKEQKVSEFRQAWIDALRADIAAVLAHAQAIHGAYVTRFASSAETWKAVRDDFYGINEAGARVKLRLNPKEAQATALLKLLEEHEGLISANPPDFAKLPRVETNLLAASQAILKSEWDRVRSGEPTYRIAQAAALGVTAACVLAIVWTIVVASRP